jgi:crotonobetainyl-CoA:carnitine CoA-transferase CaiB-like acyl-CoA transferase
VVDNFSARVMKNWGMDYESLKAVKPDIICVSMSGPGHSGPWRDYVSYGPTLQALSGMTHLMGFPGRPPQGFGYSYADHAGGATGAIAVLAALEHRANTGQGQWVDLGQLEAMTALIGPAFLDYSVNGVVAQPKGNLLHSRPCGPYGAYRCKDDEAGSLPAADRWIAIGVTNDEQWHAFVKAIGSPEWTRDQKFATQESRYAHAEELDRTRTTWRTTTGNSAIWVFGGWPTGRTWPRTTSTPTRRGSPRRPQHSGARRPGSASTTRGCSASCWG